MKKTYSKTKTPRRGRSEQAQFYINRHPVCEACHIIESQEVHHIVTRATGGPDEDWNFLALCVGDHNLFHDRGFREFCRRFPDLKYKVEAARLHMGRQV